jgi:hypothetical protein
VDPSRIRTFSRKYRSIGGKVRASVGAIFDALATDLQLLGAIGKLLAAPFQGFRCHAGLIRSTFQRVIARSDPPLAARNRHVCGHQSA